MKEIALETGLSEVQKKVIDTLAVYGEIAIPAIMEIVERATTSSVKKYGLEVIKQIKKLGL